MLGDEARPACVLWQERWAHQHLGTRRAHCGMQHAEQPALLCEKVEWLHAHEGAAKGPGFQATTREDVCNWRRTPSVTIASFPVQRKKRWQPVSLEIGRASCRERVGQNG